LLPARQASEIVEVVILSSNPMINQPLTHVREMSPHMSELSTTGGMADSAVDQRAQEAVERSCRGDESA